MAFVANLTVSSHSHVVRSPITVCSWRGKRQIASRYSSFCGRRFGQLAFKSIRFNQFRKQITPSAGFSGGGFLGVGPAEVVVIVAVGWVLLGPKQLFQLAKDSGKLLGELRRTANEARDSFSDAMELDLLAEEVEQKKREIMDEFEGASAADSKAASNPSTSTDTVELDEKEPAGAPESTVKPPEEPEVSSSFLEQLKRVTDPNQQAEQDIPDLVINDNDEEELEVRRLEKQYLEAREKLAKRRMAETRPEQTENSTPPNDGTNP